VSFRLSELAARIGGEVRGDAETRVDRLSALEKAGPGDLAVWKDARYRDAARASRAAAFVVPRSLAGEELGRPLLAVEHADLALARLLEVFHPPSPPPPGVHPTAVVGAGCAIDPSAHVGPYAVVGDGAELGAGAVVGAHAVVGRRCRIGAGSVLEPHVVLYDDTELGARVRVHAGSVLGADGFGYASVGGVHHKVPQVGRTVVEDDVEIGALSAVDRATLDETRVGAGTKIDNLVQVGHNVQLGRGCVLCGQAGIAGSARLGDYVVLGGQSGAAGHLEVGNGVQVAAKSAVLQSVEPGRKVAGVPAVDLARWRRQALSLDRLGDLRRRLRRLEQRLGLDRLDAGRPAAPPHPQEEP
jgi:UDP-3-O-[3-hydroxymyristoyl] glucosamine N-acyltransferase